MANALEQFKQLKSTHEMFDSCRSCGVLQGVHENTSELPAETMGRMKIQEKGKSNLHAEEDFVEKLESMNVDPCLSKLIWKYQEVFGALPPPLSCKKLVQTLLPLTTLSQQSRDRSRRK